VRAPRAVEKERSWLAARGAAVDALERERTQRLADFAAAARRVEVERARVVGARLRALAAELIEIGHVLEPEVSRVVDAHAAELNAALLANARDHAAAGAELEVAALEARRATEARWADADADWRARKHAAVLAAFAALLNSREFVNPPRRVAAFEALAEDARARHAARRAPALAALAALRPPALSRAAIAAARVAFESIDEDDAASRSALWKDVDAAAASVDADARARLEALRAELHG
jgi:hypothetical protein